MSNKNGRMSQVLIHTFLKKAINDIRESPERSTRNLIDLALTFSNGRFQKNFFESAQNMLHDEQSAYYKLIHDQVLHVDTDRLLTFSMNVGYSSCTAGAATIRKKEEELHFNIPWSITLIINPQRNPDVLELYQPILEQGKELGIYTWLIFSTNDTQQILPLIKANPDCAFVLFCRGEELTEDLLAESDSLHNLMFTLRYEEGVADVCSELRRRNFLYSLYFSYQEEDAGLITSGGLLCCTQELHPAFTFFLPDLSCPERIEKLIYRYVKDSRTEQKYQTIPLDFIYDNRTIDSIISSDACSAAFDYNGHMWNKVCKKTGPEYNLFKNKLSDIFQRSFPKRTEQYQ